MLRLTARLPMLWLYIFELVSRRHRQGGGATFL